MIAAWAARCRKRGLVYEVALFLAEDHWSLVEDSGVLTGTMMMLAHAYCLTGTMRVVFRGAEPGSKATPQTGYEPKIPKSIRHFANKYDIAFMGEAEISDNEGRKLFLKITGFSDFILKRFSETKIDPVTTAFLIHRGVWKREEVELILKYCISPNALLSGQLVPDNMLRWQADMTTLRRGILARRAKSLFALALDGDEDLVSYNWINEKTTEFTFKSKFTFNPLIGMSITIQPEQVLTVIPIAREYIEYELCLKYDLRLRDIPSPIVIVVTYDFELLQTEARKKAKQLASQNKIAICQINDTTGALDLEICSALQKSSNFRLMMEDQPDD